MTRRVLRAAAAAAALGAALAGAETPHSDAVDGDSFEVCLAAVLEAAPGQVVKVERKEEAGRAMYEFDVRDAAARDWDIVCDVARRVLIEREREVSSALHPDFQRTARHDERAARAAALARVDGYIVEVEYEIEENGEATYEFDIRDGSGGETKVEVNAATLEIIEVAREVWQVGLE